MHKVTAETLNQWAEFDCPFTVNDDGSVSHAFTVHGPELVEHDEDDDILIDGMPYALQDKWEPVLGFTGQYAYRGPVMHASEYLGGGMADYVLNTPGTYVVKAVEVNCLGTVEQDEFCNEDSGCDCFPAGWTLLKMRED